MSSITTESARVAELRERGAERYKAEDQHGQTRVGWWLDGVYLGNTTRQALEAING